MPCCLYGLASEKFDFLGEQVQNWSVFSFNSFREISSDGCVKTSFITRALIVTKVHEWGNAWIYAEAGD